MDLSNLKPAEGSIKKRKRIGRGQGSGRGGTSTRGHKGAKSRSGYSQKTGFEGGQMPMARRMPKFGFTYVAFREKLDIVNLSQLDKLSGEVTPETLAEAGLVRKNVLVKVLGNGELKSKLTVKAHKFSEKAKTAIESAGGKVEVI